MRFSKSGTGFTLLELLIVVVIVAILATIALPQFTKTFAKAREAEASSQLSALLAAAFAYYQEKNNKWPDKFADTSIDVPTGANWGYSDPGGSGNVLTVRATDNKKNSHTVTASITADGIRLVTFSAP